MSSGSSFALMLIFRLRPQAVKLYNIGTLVPVDIKYLTCTHNGMDDPMSPGPNARLLCRMIARAAFHFTATAWPGLKNEARVQFIRVR